MLVLVSFLFRDNKSAKKCSDNSKGLSLNTCHLFLRADKAASVVEGTAAGNANPFRLMSARNAAAQAACREPALRQLLHKNWLDLATKDAQHGFAKQTEGHTLLPCQ